MLSLDVLKKLKEDSIELNRQLKEIIASVDEQSFSMDESRNITLRVRKTFELYRSLLAEWHSQF